MVNSDHSYILRRYEKVTILWKRSGERNLWLGDQDSGMIMSDSSAGMGVTCRSSGPALQSLLDGRQG